MTGPAVRTVAVLGGGITGCVTAIALAREGIEVELIEIADELRGVGHGITIQGNALRVFEHLGVADRVLAHSYAFDNVRMLTAGGHVIADIQAPRTGGEHLPATIGTLRSQLHDTLVGAAREAGVRITTGRHATGLDQDDRSVTLTLDDGTTRTCDLVVGADGVRSQTRAMLGIETVPQPTGMSIWRIQAARPPQMTCSELYHGGPRYRAGYTPTGETTCYAYLIDEPLTPADFPGRTPGSILRERSDGYGGTWGEIRDTITDATPVNLSRIEWLLLEQPWHRGRVVLAGDAVHACPPHVAQGAAQCAEDGLVLAELLAAGGEVEKVLTAYAERRLPRVRPVVEASVQLVEWDLHPDTPGADPGGLMGRTLAGLIAPA